MPYIKQDRREVLDRTLAGIENAEYPDLCWPQDCGELNYMVTMAALRHGEIKFGKLERLLSAIGSKYLTMVPLRYQRINDLVGAFTCAAMEMHRRNPAITFAKTTLIYFSSSLYAEFGVPYELKKITENGDIDYGRKDL